MRILVVDIGGTNVKLLATGQEEMRRVPSGLGLTPRKMVEGVQEATTDWKYDVVTIGYPGPVADNRPLLEPKNLGKGWVKFKFEEHFQKPVKIINDAAMQALGSYESGKMLFLGLGTGLGSAFIVEGIVVPLELAHLPYRKDKTFEEYVGVRGLERMGKRKWQKVVEDVVARLKAAFVADYVVLGGGNVKKLDTAPPGARIGDNQNAFIGGFRLWQENYPHPNKKMTRARV